MSLFLSRLGRFVLGKLGERPILFDLSPDPALLVELPRTHQLDLVGGVRGGILIADVRRRKALQRAQDVQRRNPPPGQPRPRFTAKHHGYTAEITLLKKKPRSAETRRISNAESISTRSEPRCSMRNVLMRTPAPPVVPIKPVQLKTYPALGVIRPAFFGRWKSAALRPPMNALDSAAPSAAWLYTASMTRTSSNSRISAMIWRVATAGLGAVWPYLVRSMKSG